MDHTGCHKKRGVVNHVKSAHPTVTGDAAMTSDNPLGNATHRPRSDTRRSGASSGLASVEVTAVMSDVSCPGCSGTS
jgi:hypothetical protein